MATWVNRAIDTSNKTRILLSFPMMNHGGNFAHWLRWRLMNHYGFSAPDAVYCDCVSSRSGRTIHVNKQHTDPTTRKTETAHSVISRSDADKAASTYDQNSWRENSNPGLNRVQSFLYNRLGYSVVSPDVRQRHDAQGYAPIGAMNKAWDSRFQHAMETATGMVFVLTADYVESKWCMQEIAQFHKENAKRKAGNKIRAAALRFVDTARLASADMTGITVLPVTKVPSPGGMLWHKDDFAIGDGDFDKLVEVLGPMPLEKVVTPPVNAA